MESYYPDMTDFYNELRFVPEAAKVSLENVYNDVNEIKKGMEDTTKEYETHNHPVLKEFLTLAEKKVQKITEDAEAAQNSFKQTVEFFGETVKTMPPEQFFPMFDKFIKNYKKAEEDIDKWRAANQKRAAKEQRKVAEEQARARQAQKESQDQAFAAEQNAIKELRALRRRDRTSIMNQDGAIDENLAYLKKQPYRRADAVQRSFRGRKGQGKTGGRGQSGAGGA